MRLSARAAMTIAALLVLDPPPSHASAGVNIAWDNCMPEGGASSKAFDCSTNSGSETMWGSFVLASDQSQFVGIEAVIDIQTDSEGLPDWWQVYNSGACRSTALSASFDFTGAPSIDCTDPWSGQGGGGISAYQTFWTSPQVPSGNPYAARLKLAFAWPSDSPQSLAAGVEYYAFKLILAKAKTIGTGSCAGCSIGACIVLSELKAVELDGTLEDLTDPITSSVVSWQSPSGGCSGSTPQQNVLWGQIRSILR